MDCFNLNIMIVPQSGAKLNICKAGGRAYGRYYYAPTHIQLFEYCKSDEHNRCPFYLNNLVRSTSPLSQLSEKERRATKPKGRLA